MISTRLAAIADGTGLLAGILSARRAGLGPSGLLVVLYHRVAALTGLGELDADLVDATPEEFDTQMGHLARHYQPVSIEEVLEAHHAGRDLPPASVLVTFDDGYLDNHENALPILERHGIRGLFFISTGHLTERSLFWWERLSLTVRRSARAGVHIDYPAPEDLDCSSASARALVIRRLNRIVKDHYGLDLARFLDEISAAFEVPWVASEERALADGSLMTWDHVRALRAAGMGIGSHTRGHRVLQTLKPAELAQELSASRATLEHEIGEPVTTIAYPVGKRISRIRPVRQAVAAAGYELGFTTTPGLNRFASGADPLDLKRLPIDRGTPSGLQHTRMALPFLNLG
jgi:peptidoglycan/xylan/chitin deacetylase (PgdA/CDA1 family)